jgi:hypothetical protein
MKKFSDSTESTKKSSIKRVRAEVVIETNVMHDSSKTIEQTFKAFCIFSSYAQNEENCIVDFFPKNENSLFLFLKR